MCLSKPVCHSVIGAWMCCVACWKIVRDYSLSSSYHICLVLIVCHQTISIVSHLLKHRINYCNQTTALWINSNHHGGKLASCEYRGGGDKLGGINCPWIYLIKFSLILNTISCISAFLWMAHATELELILFSNTLNCWCLSSCDRIHRYYRTRLFWLYHNSYLDIIWNTEVAKHSHISKRKYTYLWFLIY